MKSLPVLLLAAVCCECAAAPARAAELEFYCGGLIDIGLVSGSGTWGGTSFETTNLFPEEEGDPLGLAWSDGLLLGGAPFVGVRLSEAVSIQAAYTFCLPKPGSQIYEASDFYNYYATTFTSEWRQDRLDVTGVLHPPGTRMRLYAGWTRIDITAKVNGFEELSYADIDGMVYGEYGFESSRDGITTNGLLLGIGVDFPNPDAGRDLFVTLEYVSARVRGDFLGIEDFDVDVGGFSLRAGVRFHPFR